MKASCHVAEYISPAHYTTEDGLTRITSNQTILDYNFTNFVADGFPFSIISKI
jgi:hypothetical protein